MKNKRGWIRIIEAFTAILIISGIILLVLSGQGLKSPDQSTVISNSEISILNGIQLNNTLRAEILATSGKVVWNNFSTDAPQTQTYINDQRPSTLDCAAQICDQGSSCLFTNGIDDKSVYAESVTITSTISEFNPRVLKLFCWEK